MRGEVCPDIRKNMAPEWERGVRRQKIPCTGYLDHPFLKNETQQENSQAH